MADQTQAYPVVQCSAILSLVFTLWIHHTYIFIHNNLLSLIICRQAVPGADQTSSQYDAGMYSECYSEPTKSPLMCISFSLLLRAMGRTTTTTEHSCLAAILVCWH